MLQKYGLCVSYLNLSTLDVVLQYIYRILRVVRTIYDYSILVQGLQRTVTSSVERNGKVEITPTGRDL